MRSQSYAAPRILPRPNITRTSVPSDAHAPQLRSAPPVQLWRAPPAVGPTCAAHPQPRPARLLAFRQAIFTPRAQRSPCGGRGDTRHAAGLVRWLHRPPPPAALPSAAQRTLGKLLTGCRRPAARAGRHSTCRCDQAVRKMRGRPEPRKLHRYVKKYKTYWKVKNNAARLPSAAGRIRRPQCAPAAAAACLTAAWASFLDTVCGMRARSTVAQWRVFHQPRVTLQQRLSTTRSSKNIQRYCSMRVGAQHIMKTGKGLWAEELSFPVRAPEFRASTSQFWPEDH